MHAMDCIIRIKKVPGETVEEISFLNAADVSRRYAYNGSNVKKKKKINQNLLVGRKRKKKNVKKKQVCRGGVHQLLGSVHLSSRVQSIYVNEPFV